MNKKIITGAIAGGVAAFLLGWLVFGLLLGGFYNSHMVHYEGLMIDPPRMPTMFVANLAWASVLAWLFSKTGVNDWMGGVMHGAIIFFFVMLGFDLYFYASMNLFQPTALAVDVIVNTIFMGIIGGIIALAMSMVS